MTQRGIVKNITFHNPDNGYSVLKLTDPDTQKNFTAVGNFAKLAQGEHLEIQGEWVTHATYGSQLKTTSYKILPPNDSESLFRYLASGIFKGVGPVQARLLVDRFGMETFEVLDNAPEKLREIPELSAKKRDNILVRWKEKKSLKEVMYFLQSHGLGLNLASRIHKAYGAATLQIIRENPYKLAEDMWGIGFIKADEIAAKMGFDKDSYERIKAGLNYALQGSVEQGHVYLSREELLQRAGELLGSDPELLVYTLDNLVDESLLHKDEGGRYYKPYLFFSERGICRRLGEMLALERDAPEPAWVQAGIEEAEALFTRHFKTEFRYNEQQKMGIAQAAEAGVFLLTGGPGTGKTTTLMGILKVLQQGQTHFRLTAPTGRAAKRLHEVTGYEAMTLHRLLGYDPESGGFLHGENKNIPGDAIVVDEVSMIDTHLMYSLLRAMTPRQKLILVGDPHQLPSIGPGKILSELIDSETVPHLHLTEIIRQEAGSDIVRNAHLIHRGQMPELPESGSDFIHYPTRSTEETTRLILHLISKEIPGKFGYHPLEDLQLITPMNKGPLGTEALNNAIQETLNPAGQGLKWKKTEFKKGDKVMQLRNNYEKNVFNGDIGFVESVDTSERSLVVMFDDRVGYPYEDLDQLGLAYAVTVHKSQGSEYQAVLVLMSGHHNIMLQRNLFYTAITRARQQVFLVANPTSIAKAVHHNPTIHRNTQLAARLRESLKPMDLPF